MLEPPGTSNRPCSSATTACFVSPAVRPMWTWAVVSNAINPAFSPPHVPSIGPWKRGPPISQSRTRISVRPARTSLFMSVPPYRLPLHPAPRHKQLLHQVRCAPPRRLCREIDHEPVSEHGRGDRAEIVLVRHGPAVARRPRFGPEDQILARPRPRAPRHEPL